MSQSKRVSQVEASFLFAYRANIERYEKLLQTYLTDHERAFIERRLHEEQQAIAQLTESAAA